MTQRTASNKHFKIWFYILIYCFAMIFSGLVLPKIGISFISNNLSFFSYLLTFISIIFLFPIELVNAAKGLNKKGFSRLITIGYITFFLEVFAAIGVSLLNVENRNQISIDSDVLANSFLLKTTIILLAPVAEEIMYRFCIFSAFSPNKIIAYIVSILLFAFMHVWDYVIFDKDYTQLIAMLPYAALGTGACVLYDKTDNIAYPILLHIAMNAIAEIA